MLLRAYIGSVDLANDGDIGPFSLSEPDHHHHEGEESGHGTLAAIPGVGDSAGAANLGDGSSGAVGQIPTALYDPNDLPAELQKIPAIKPSKDESGKRGVRSQRSTLLSMPT
jgi:hypothetical protein